MRHVVAVVLLACIVFPGAAWAREIWDCKFSDDQESISESFEVKGNTALRSPDDYSSMRLPFDVVEDSAVGLVAIHHDKLSVILLTINKSGGEAKQIGTNLSIAYVDVGEGTCTLR